MTEFFNVNTMSWQTDNLTKMDKIKAYVKENFPDVMISYGTNGMIEVGDDTFTLTATQKTNIKAILDAL